MGSAAGNALSGRELEVLKMAVCDLSTAEIADALGLSSATVKRHLAYVYEKLGESSRNGAVAAALAEGWLGWKDLLPDGQGLPTEGGAVLAGAVYRCAAPGCGREVVEVRPTATPRSGARLTCHGRQMERTEPPEVNPSDFREPPRGEVRATPYRRSSRSFPSTHSGE